MIIISSFKTRACSVCSSIITLFYVIIVARIHKKCQYQLLRHCSEAHSNELNLCVHPQLVWALRWVGGCRANSADLPGTTIALVRMGLLRLDRFLAHHVVLHVEQYWAWVGELCCSGHYPAFLELDKSSSNPGAPFNYNRHRQEEEEFQALIKENWKLVETQSEAPICAQFMASMQFLKEKVTHKDKEHHRNKGFKSRWTEH